MRGDHRNLKLHGACASVKSPMILISTPSRASQTGIAIHTRPSGNPEENDSRLTAAVRQLLSASHTLRQAGGSFFTGLSAERGCLSGRRLANVRSLCTSYTVRAGTGSVSGRRRHGRSLAEGRAFDGG